MKRICILVAVFFCLVIINAFGQKKEVAISGYDPVSYFMGTPSLGSATYQSTFQGSTYNFLSKESKSTFDTNPKKYSPQYGGWCAYAMGLDGSKVVVNPESYKMVAGKLYLFYKQGFVDTKSKWKKNEVTLKSNADKNWASKQ